MRITGTGTGEAVPELDPPGPFPSVRAVPELAASTECDLPGPADGSGCL